MDLYNQYEILILMGLFMMIVLVFIMFSMMIRKIRVKTIELLYKIKANLVYNGLIRSVQISFIKNCLGFEHVFKSLMLGVHVAST